MIQISARPAVTFILAKTFASNVMKNCIQSVNSRGTFHIWHLTEDTQTIRLVVRRMCPGKYFSIHNDAMSFRGSGAIAATIGAIPGPIWLNPPNMIVL